MFRFCVQRYFFFFSYNAQYPSFLFFLSFFNDNLDDMSEMLCFLIAYRFCVNLGGKSTSASFLRI